MTRRWPCRREHSKNPPQPAVCAILARWLPLHSTTGAPAVPSDRVSCQGSSTTQPSSTERRITSLAVGWHPTTRMPGEAALSTAAAADGGAVMTLSAGAGAVRGAVQHAAEGSMTKGRLEGETLAARRSSSGAPSFPALASSAPAAMPATRPPPPTGTNTASSLSAASCMSSSSATVPCPPATCRRGASARCQGTVGTAQTGQRPGHRRPLAQLFSPGVSFKMLLQNPCPAAAPVLLYWPGGRCKGKCRFPPAPQPPAAPPAPPARQLHITPRGSAYSLPSSMAASD